MKTIFFLQLFFWSAVFSFAQNDEIAAVTSLGYLDNYSNFQTHWKNNWESNKDRKGELVFFGGSGNEVRNTVSNANPMPAFSLIHFKPCYILFHITAY